MPRHKFTERWIAGRTAPRDTRLEYCDLLLPGLRLRVSGPDVRIFSAVVRADGRLKRHTIGRHPRWTLADARTEAMRLLRGAGVTLLLPISAEAAAPLQHIAAAPAAPAAPAEAPIVAAVPPALTYAAMIDAYEELHLRPNTRSWKSIARDARSPALAHLLERPAAEISRRDIIGVLDALMRAGTPQAAVSVHRHIGMAYRWAWRREMVSSNPVERIQRPAPTVERDRVLSDAELAAVWRATFQLPDPFGQFVRLLALLGQRRTETASMRWSHIVETADGPEWHLPRTKNGKPHTVPLPPLAMATIAALPRPTGDGYVFSTDGGNTHCSSYSKRKSELDVAAGQGVLPWRYHDLRRGCRSGLARLGVPRDICRKIIGHSEGVVDRIYDRFSALPARRSGLTLWQDHILALVSEKRPAAAGLPPRDGLP